MDEELKKLLEDSKKGAKEYVGKPPRTRKKSSLHQIIKTKEQADRFMRDLKAAESQ